MSVSAISSLMTSTSAAVQAAGGAKSSEIDGSDFMTLLLAQLKNQDPMKPMDSDQMMGQLTQLNSLDALQSIQKSIEAMNKSNKVSYAASLIGKTITAVPDVNKPDEIITGIVTSTTIDDGVAMVQVDGQDVNVSSIVAVSGG